jgi:hypothetical protein
MTINLHNKENLDPKIYAILEKVEQLTKDSITDLFIRFDEIKEDQSLGNLITFALSNLVVMHVQALSKSIEIPPIQVYSQLSNAIIQCL